MQIRNSIYKQRHAKLTDAKLKHARAKKCEANIENAASS